MDNLKETITEEKEELTVSRNLLMTKDNAQFSVAATESSPAAYFNIHLIGEISSRVLFSTINWLRQLPFFSSLKHSNQRKLLRQSWSDLFVLGLAQVSQEIHLTNILSAIADNIQTISALAELREKTNHQDSRYSKLLLRLSPLRSLQQDVLEEIFFGGLIGNVQIDTVIPTLLNMEQGELNQLLEA